MGNKSASFRNPQNLGGLDGSGIPGIRRVTHPGDVTTAALASEFYEQHDVWGSLRADEDLSEGIGTDGPLWGIGSPVAMPAALTRDDLKMQQSDLSLKNAMQDDLVLCVFTWTHGGHNVSLTGSFNNWSYEDRIRMIRNGHEFTVVKELKKGKHSYKFIVDDVWRFAPDQQTATDERGNINNILDISDHQYHSFKVPSTLEQARVTTFHQYIPEATDYSTEAPLIPVLFSKTICPAADPPPRTAAPLHSVANHMYHDALAPNVFGPHISVIATTHRWRGSELFAVQGQKHSTIVFVTLNPLFVASASSYLLLNDITADDPLKEFINSSIARKDSSKVEGGTNSS